jgi:hypothetical protein
MMADTAMVNAVRERLVNTLRAMSLSRDELERLTPDFLSPERMVADDWNDDMECARSCEQAGMQVFPIDVWTDLEQVSRKVNRLSRLIYADLESAPSVVTIAWHELVSEAVRVIAKHDLGGPVNKRHYL